MKYFVGVVCFVTPLFCSAESIGFGKVVAVKQYDLGSHKAVKIYLASDATNTESNCNESGKIYGSTTHSKHDEATINRMFSLATAAYMSGKKIRLHSDSESCEIDFLAIQDSVF